jgi:hypothetical protein
VFYEAIPAVRYIFSSAKKADKKDTASIRAKKKSVRQDLTEIFIHLF